MRHLNLSERRFIECLKKIIESSGITDYDIVTSSEEDDMHKHIDIKLILYKETQEKRREFTFDVKGLKKKHRSDKDYMYDETWVELINVHGENGWLYGDEVYIAFETKAGFTIVRRIELANMIESKCKDETIYTKIQENDFYYKYYQRKNKQDKMVLIPIKDLESLYNRKI